MEIVLTLDINAHRIQVFKIAVCNLKFAIVY
jgi:hypothetical protein